MSVDILVFGSCFMDYIAYMERIPSPGETLHSHQFQVGFGGKGANQTVAAARLTDPNDKADVKVAMAGCVGSDHDGDAYVENLKKAGVDTSLMRRLPDKATGIALITVDAKGRNAITICPNAAGETRFASAGAFYGTKSEVFTARDFTGILKPNGIFVVQNEIPLEATLSALKVASDAGMHTIFNPAPAPSRQQLQRVMPYLKYIWLITPNEHEAFLMTGVKVVDLPSAGQAVEKLRQLGARDVIITMGEKGCAIQGVGRTHPVLVPPKRVKAVDTTGAGDSWIGSLAYFLAKGLPLMEACRRANIIAAFSVMRKGTQSSYRGRSELPSELFSNLKQNSKL